jgi:dephospho-CoA kinase
MGLRIGLTGGIGSGKSSVAQALVQAGAWLVDTDAISRSLTAPGGAALPALRQEFTTTLFNADGTLNRDRLRALVFADPSAKHRLEAVLHPMIGDQARREARSAGERSVVFDVPLLAETGVWRTRCDRILVVDCSEAAQIDRVMRRSGWSADQVRRVIAQQASRSARRAIADAVIHNEDLELSTLGEHARAVLKFWSP